MFKGKIFSPRAQTIHNLILESHQYKVAAGHPRQARPLDVVLRNYYWQSMKKFVNSYIGHWGSCICCKPFNQLPTGLWKPLETPDCPWEGISCNVVRGLPTDKGFTAIFMV